MSKEKVFTCLWSNQCMGRLFSYYLGTISFCLGQETIYSCSSRSHALLLASVKFPTVNSEKIGINTITPNILVFQNRTGTAQASLPLQFPNSIYLMLATSLLLTVRHPKCCLWARLPWHYQRLYWASLITITYASLIQSVQENVNNNSFSSLVKCMVLNFIAYTK
jgi:hypothetical protein